MKRLFVIFLMFCVILCGCNTSFTTDSTKSQSGVSDGTFSFDAGNIKFTIPTQQQYILTEAVGDQTSVTICGFGLGSADLIISVIDCSDSSESEISESLTYWNKAAVDTCSDFTYDSNTTLTVMGEKIQFSIYVDYSSENPVSHYISTFTDSHYIYSMKIQLRSSSSSVLNSVRNTITSSEYIGPQKRFSKSQ